MTLRVATVLSAREWESRLVAAARSSATVRLVLRAFLPTEISDHAHAIDVVVVGSETPWATTARLSSWSREGLCVVGIHPAGDRPAADRLRRAGADLVISDDVGPEVMLREIRLVEPAVARVEGTLPLIAVTGARGAPGRTEVAIAVAWNLSGGGETTLIDADLAAPAIAVRTGIAPRPDLADAVDAVHTTGVLSDDLLHRLGRLRVLPGSHRQGEPPLRADPIYDVVDAARAATSVVVDVGPWPANQEIIKAASTAIVVVDSHPIGIVRAAALASGWTGPPPALVVNRVGSKRREDVLTAVRRWTGLDPAAVIPVLRAVALASRSAGAPPRRLRRLLIGTEAPT